MLSSAMNLLDADDTMFQNNRYPPDFPSYQPWPIDGRSENGFLSQSEGSQPQQQQRGGFGDGKGGKGNNKGGRGKGNSKGEQGDSMGGYEGQSPDDMFAMRMGGAPPMSMLGGFPSDALGAGMTLMPPNGNSAPPPEWANTTTVMMRNLPNKYTQRMLLTEINHSGFLGTFDFLYLPIDPETNANRGYTFLNFIDPSFAWMFKISYEGRKMNRFNSNKVVSVTAATLQGFEANYAHYATARVNRGDPAARPLFLREPKQDGRGAFPTGAGGQADGKRRDKPRRGKGEGGDQMPMQPQRQQQQQQQQGMPGGTYMAMDGAADLPQMPYPQNTGNSLEPPAPARSGGELGGGGGGAGGGTASMVPRFCPHCGCAIQPGFQFCPQCGSNTDFSMFKGQ